MEGMELFDPISTPKKIRSVANVRKLPKEERIVIKAGSNKNRKATAEKGIEQ